MSTVTTKQFSLCPQAVQAFSWIHRRTGTFGFGGTVTVLPEKKLHSARMPEFCNRNTKALIFYEKENRLLFSDLVKRFLFQKYSYFETLHTLRSLSTVYTRSSKIRNLSKKVISPVALSENVNYRVHTVHNDLIALRMMLQGSMTARIDATKSLFSCNTSITSVVVVFFFLYVCCLELTEPALWSAWSSSLSRSLGLVPGKEVKAINVAQRWWARRNICRSQAIKAKIDSQFRPGSYPERWKQEEQHWRFGQILVFSD